MKRTLGKINKRYNFKNAICFSYRKVLPEFQDLKAVLHIHSPSFHSLKRSGFFAWAARRDRSRCFTPGSVDHRPLYEPRGGRVGTFLQVSKIHPPPPRECHTGVKTNLCGLFPKNRKYTRKINSLRIGPAGSVPRSHRTWEVADRRANVPN